MNILFFLKPKGEVAYIHDYCTLRQVLETITEGDLLWFIKSQHNMDIKKAENVFITDFPRKNNYFAVSADADMEDLLQKAMNQNFVPVVDDMNNFIGIITRKSIIEYCYNQLLELKAKGECND